MTEQIFLQYTYNNSEHVATFVLFTVILLFVNYPTNIQII